MTVTLACCIRRLLIIAIALVPASVRADITGFHDFRLNRSDTSSPPVLVDADTIQLTSGPNQRRSLWFTTPQDISEFTATFTYRAADFGTPTGHQGLAFVIQNDADGVNALGSTATAGGFGYRGIEPSAAISIEFDAGVARRTYTNFYSVGELGGGATPTFPVTVFNGREIDVTIIYDGSQLSVAMIDGADVFPPRNYLIGSLADLVGGSDAYIGFTAGTGGTSGASQFISDFRFVEAAVPEPASASLAVIAGGVLAAMHLLRRRRGAGGRT